MSLKRFALGVSVLATLLASPLAFPQDGGAGNPDDVASLLPAETSLFAEVVRPGRIYKDRLEYLGAFCTKDGRAEVLEKLEKAFKEQSEAEGLPEKLQKDIEKGFPTVQRMAVAMGRYRAGRDLFWAVVATASSDEFFKSLIDDFRVFSAEEKTHGDAKILVVRKLGKQDLHPGLYLSAVGKRFVLSTNLESVLSVLDRAAGKGKDGDLRKNANYARFSPPTGDDPAVRAFAEVNWGGLNDLVGGGWGYRRASAHGMDVADAALGFRKVRGATLEATLKPGKIAATTRILIDSPCPIYDILRQPAGAKETLKLVPADAQIAVHFNLRGGRQLLEDIDKLVKRFAEIEKKSHAKNAAPPDLPEFDWKKGFEQEVGIPIEDAAAAIGAEVAFAMVGKEALMGEQNMVGSLLFVVGLADPDKAKAVIEKMAGKLGPYETKKEGDATFWVPPQEGSHPVFALQGKMALIGAKAETLKKALKTGADGTGFLKQLPAGVAGASKTVAIRNNALWSLAKLGLGGKLPDIEKHLDLEALSAILFTEEKSEWRISSQDAGLGTVVQAGVMMVPLAFVMVGAMRGAIFAGDVDEDPAGKKADAPKEAPPLPEDKLAAEVKKHLAGMRADDVVARDDAESALKALGPQAAKLLAEAVRREGDSEVKGRILGILAAWKAYDAYPELLKSKVDKFLTGFQKATGEENGGRFVQWRQEGMAEFPYGMEPGWADTSLVRRVEHHDVLDAPQGVRALAEKLTGDKLNVQQVRNLSAVFAYNECGAAGDLLAAARQKVEDPEAKCFLQIALGWASDPKARELLLAGLRDPDVWIRRASFLGLEKSKDTAAIPRLIELLSDKDHETRWNASFTLRELTAGNVWVNVYAPEDELKASVAAGRDWWEKSKASFKIGQ